MATHSVQSRCFKNLIFALLICMGGSLFSGCRAQSAPLKIATIIEVDGKQISVNLASENTVQHALDSAGVIIGNQDIVDPAIGDPVTENMIIRVTRVKETFEVEESIIAFERQTMRNESIPDGQTMLIQKGINGIQQTTYRRVYEDDVEVSRTEIKTINLKEALPEILMIGVQSPFSSIPIEGRIAYLTTGNAWIMDSSTGNRKPVVTTGDLDGRIFSLSPDGTWLLYTRSSNEGVTDIINSLWAVDITSAISEPIDLQVNNVIQHAAWVPAAETTVTYSMVEPRETAPGWQANNDLFILSFNAEGGTLRRDEIIEANSGGVYGWWGTSYSWSPDGNLLAYARPDEIGLVDVENGKLVPLTDIIPLQTRGDWAWVPALGWAPDHSVLYTVKHSPKAGQSNFETSPVFDLTGLLQGEGMMPITIVPQSGMFSYPVPSPEYNRGQFNVAFLQAIFPEQSDTSHYNLIIMDQDGSNRKLIFPKEGSLGLSPQGMVWGPSPAGAESLWLGIVYQGNLWLLNPSTKLAQQITGDGSINKIDWK
jgi:hypothetical protein